MLELLMGAALPVIVVLGLGYFAGWHRDFDTKQGAILTRMVLLYALPLFLIVGTSSLPRDKLIAQLPIALTIMAVMILSFAITLSISYFIGRQKLAAATLQALIISAPALPFVGLTVLARLFGNTAPDIPIAACTITLNLFLIPLSVFMLTKSTEQSNEQVSFFSQIYKTIQEPIVWAPLLGLIFSITNIPLPSMIKDSMFLLGQTAGGVALFACGVLLFSYNITFTPSVVIAAATRTIVIPVITWIVLYLFGMPEENLRIIVLSIGFPAMAIVPLLAVRFHLLEQEMASILALCNIFWIIVAWVFVWMMT